MRWLAGMTRAEPLTIGARTAFPLLAIEDVNDPEVAVGMEMLRGSEMACKDVDDEWPGCDWDRLMWTLSCGDGVGKWVSGC